MFYGIFSGIRKRKPGGVLNILLRACRCARVWFVQKRSGKVKIPAGWSGKDFRKDGILYRMTRKKSGNTPRGREKMFVRTENSFRKMRIFPLKKFRRSAKNIETGRKISQFHSGKGRKNYSDEAKKSQKTDDPNEKTADYFLQADGKNAEKDARQDRKICRSIRKNMKIPRRKEKRCISGRMVHSEKNGFFIKRIRKKDRLMEKKQENHNRQGRKHS